jgi:transcriptional regulator with XRE-family HTH domain
MRSGGMSHKEIAQALGLSKTEIQRIESIALRKIRQRVSLDEWHAILEWSYERERRTAVGNLQKLGAIDFDVELDRRSKREHYARTKRNR